jgi:hypothetical protein
VLLGRGKQVVRERIDTRQSRLRRKWRTTALGGDKKSKNEQRREDVCDRHGKARLDASPEPHLQPTSLCPWGLLNNMGSQT